MGDYHEKPGSPGDILEHHGVKGMKWGVRKKDEPSGRSSSGVASTGPKEAEYNRMAQAIASNAKIDPKLAAAKYGPRPIQDKVEQEHRAREDQLQVLAGIAGVTIGVAALGMAARNLREDRVDFAALYAKEAQAYREGLLNADPARGKLQTLFDTNNKAYSNVADGLAINWENGVELPAGSVLRRLSTVAEEVPRPEGFYAAHLDGDVQSYKAILPTFWEGWGFGRASDGGFLNHYQASDAIRAPSGKDSFAIFKKMAEQPEFNQHFVGMFNPNGLRNLGDAELKATFQQWSLGWARPSRDVTQYFEELKKQGYNSVIDFNDAGKLGKTPLRVLDGTMFKVVKNEPQSLDDFYDAAKNWHADMVHTLMSLGAEFLAHMRIKYGRKAVF